MAIGKRHTKTGEVRWAVTWREGGKQREKWHRSKRDAQHHEDEVRRIKRNGLRPVDDRMTVQQLVDVWREAHGNGLRQRTREKNDAQLNQRILPEWGHYRCVEIDTMALDAWLLRLVAAGVSPVTINQTRATMRQIFEAAVRWELLHRNPVAATKRRPLPRGQVDPIDFDDVLAIAHAAGKISTRDYAMVMVGSLCGPRVGELLGLQWRDIRSDHIHIERSVDESLTYAPLKDYEERDVPLPDLVAAALAEWRAVAPTGDVLFPNTRGGLLHDGNWRSRVWRPAVATAAHAQDDPTLAERNPGEMRHTFASLAIDLGLPIHWIQQRMGHSKPSITLDTYGHLYERRNSTAAVEYNAALNELATNVDPATTHHADSTEG